MAIAKMGKLVEVDIRKLWEHEQYDFSKWLSDKENLELLNDAIGLSLTEVETEVYVGAYRCDLVGKDEVTGEKVIIENQLEASNHDHLGKIITYASGLDANVIVWIVKEAREEHRSAVEWLNNNTSTNINFFLIEVHAYKIGDSNPAPMFEVVEKPNGFIKNAKNQSGSSDLNKSQSERLEFWTQFNDVIVERGKPFKIRKASTDHWYDIAIGTSVGHVALNLVNKEGCVVVELYINDDKELYDSPVTMTAGDVMPASLTFNSISASVPLTILYVSSNPPVITAAGVFLGLPPLTSASVICARCVSPIRYTQVPFIEAEFLISS